MGEPEKPADYSDGFPIGGCPCWKCIKGAEYQVRLMMRACRYHAGVRHLSSPVACPRLSC